MPMTLTPDEIRSQQFRKSFRGADPGEVASFLDRIATDIESSAHDDDGLRQRLTSLETQLQEYKNIEKILQQTLLQAQETGTRSVENARKESELILQQTEIKASAMLDQARRELSGIKEQITILLSKKDYIITRVKMLLNAELETLKTLEADPNLSAS